MQHTAKQVFLRGFVAGWLSRIVFGILASIVYNQRVRLAEAEIWRKASKYLDGYTEAKEQDNGTTDV